MDDTKLDWLVTNRMVERDSVRMPGNEVVPLPKPHECVVFRDKFCAGLRFPCQDFLEDVLDAYNIEMHHLTPNGIVKVALFIWALRCQDVTPDIAAFCALHEMHTQFKQKVVDGKKIVKYFGCCNFKPARGAK